MAWYIKIKNNPPALIIIFILISAIKVEGSEFEIDSSETDDLAPASNRGKIFFEEVKLDDLKSLPAQETYGESLIEEKIYFDSQELEPMIPTFRSCSYRDPLFSSSPLISFKHHGYLNVDTSLKKCTKRLNIYSDSNADHFFLPPRYDASCLISVCLRAQDGQIKHYQVYDPHHELMNDQEFSPREKARGGTRIVGFYSINGKRRLCVKQWPEAPGHDIAVYHLYKTLFPEDDGDLPLPVSETIIMNGQVFLVSEFIDGETLEQVFEKVEKDTTYGRKWVFNPEKFQKLVIFSFFINPEDGRSQNYLIKKIKDSDEYQFILIDNERSLGEEHAEYDHPKMGKITTRVHCGLLCFYENFNEKVSQQLLQKFEVKSSLLKPWILKCRTENQYQRKLQEQLREEDYKKSRLGVNYSPKLIKGIAEKLRIVKKTCSLEKEIFAKIFWQMNPRLAHTYQIPLGEAMFMPGDINPISLAHVRILSIDGGRAGTATPPSSYVPIEKYLGSADLPVIVPQKKRRLNTLHISPIVEMSTITFPLKRSYSSP